MRELSFTMAGLHAAYAAGADPAGVVAEAYRRIEEAGDPGIFLHLIEREAAMAEAAALGRFDPATKPLWGIPFAVKDNIDIAGAPTTAACPAFAYEAKQDAFAVARLRRAGAIPIGKTNLDQFATGLVGTRSPYPAPRNAVDARLVPGGSSSGSAVAVARGVVGFALGTDTAGSGRVPAALNNIVGLKPTLGAISNTGVVPACRTLDTVSVFALTVDDAHAVFRCAAGCDAADAYSRPVAAAPLSPLPPEFRIGVPDAATAKFFGDAAQQSCFEAAKKEVTALGGKVEEIDFALFYQVAEMLYDGVWVAERYAVVEKLIRERPEALHPVTRDIIAGAEALSAADAFRGLYRLKQLRRRLAPLVERLDFICVPTVPAFCTLQDLAADPIGANSRLGTYTNFVNLLDLCGIAVPVARRPDGLPGGVTVLAAAGRDGQAAALASALHRRSGVPLGATGWPQPQTPPPSPAERNDEIALAVVGAHMSGLPLNGELTRLGARFLRQARTAPCYRLYRLAGGPPYRPGLVRMPEGASIALEIWALPAARFGDFIRGIPRPLGIGTLTLDDGGEVKGFLCEASGLAGGEDITRYGGWRNFLTECV